MICPSCPVPLPLVTVQTAQAVLAMIDRDDYPKLVVPASQWLLMEHPGISFYEKITGRLHTIEERAAIADDTAQCSATMCPYSVALFPSTCIIEELNSKIRISRVPGQHSYMWLPAVLMMLIDRPLYAKMVKENRVADVKYCVLSRDEAFYR